MARRCSLTLLGDIGYRCDVAIKDARLLCWATCDVDI